MKNNILKHITGALCLAAVAATMSGCAGMDGDGIDTVVWEGSTNPDNTGFHNPVWEPSLDGGTIFKGASSYVAISSTTQWAAGLTYYCPVLTSNNLTTWNKSTADAFTEDNVPTGDDGARLSSLTVDFARTYSGNKYWLFYTIEGQNAICCASSSSPQGVYTPLGTVELKNDPQGLAHPFFFVQSKNYYLCYTTSDGVYLQKIGLSKNGATVGSANDPVKIASSAFKEVAVYLNSSDDVYLFGTVDGEIRYARAAAATGPYLDRQGADIAQSGRGEALITANEAYSSVSNPMRAFLNSEGTHLYLCYNAQKAGQPTMASGFARKPVFVQPFAMGEDGWLEGTATPREGWTSPTFE